jgi:hypothetical protein
MARDDRAASPLGGRVERTGLGVVRRGEIVVAAGDSGALVGAPAAPPSRVTLEFAVTVEVGPSAEEVGEQAAVIALRRLREALAARATG